jgi:hypothetical protein
MEKIKEAGQYTFGDDYADSAVVDSFYDDDKVYKTLYKKFKAIVEPLEKGDYIKSAKDLVEDIYDYVGEVPDTVSLDKYLEELFMEDDFIEEIYDPLIRQPIVEAYNAAAKYAEEYHKSEDYWGDVEYIIWEQGEIFDKNKNLPKEVESFLAEQSLSRKDLEDFVSNEHDTFITQIDFSYMRGLDDEKYIILFSSPIGEIEDQPDDSLLDAYKALPKDDQEYISSTCDAYINKSGDIFVDLSYDIVTFFVEWKDIKKQFAEYMEVEI